MKFTPSSPKTLSPRIYGQYSSRPKPKAPGAHPDRHALSTSDVVLRATRLKLETGETSA